jgi:hypothetical protein
MYVSGVVERDNVGDEKKRRYPLLVGKPLIICVSVSGGFDAVN